MHNLSFYYIAILKLTTNVKCNISSKCQIMRRVKLNVKKLFLFTNLFPCSAIFAASWRADSRFYLSNFFFLSQEFSPRIRNVRVSPSYIYGRCILLADYLVCRRTLMDESKQGYANLCCRRQLLPTYRRLGILQGSFSLLGYSCIRERFAGTNFALFLFHCTRSCCHISFFQIWVFDVLWEKYD